MNPWLLLLSFVLGVVLAWLWAVRPVRRELPAALLVDLWEPDAETGEASPAAAARARRAQEAARQESEPYDQDSDPADD